MAVLTVGGKATYQEALFPGPFHLAWGSGSVGWGDTPPAEDVNAVALLAEVGRLEATAVEFVVPDVAGVIELNFGNFTVSATPTRYLYLDFHFGFDDGAAETIREVAVFVGTTKEVGVPGGQVYLLPADVDESGSLLIVEHQAPAIVRANTNRERFQYVITL